LYLLEKNTFLAIWSIFPNCKTCPFMTVSYIPYFSASYPCSSPELTAFSSSSCSLNSKN
jgi:hypothetical protein